MRHSLLVLAFFVVLPFISCCSNPPGPEPIDNFDRLVQERAEQWLDPRMDDDSWQIFHSQEDIWSNSASLVVLADWFKVNLGDPSGVPVFWDFAAFIQELKGSDLFTRGPPTDAQLLQLLIKALKSYHYEG